MSAAVLTRFKTWKILTTPPMSGPDNMAYDVSTMQNMHNEDRPPVLRFFRWVRPAVSYGKHQRLDGLRTFIPSGWETIQRPTGGGAVLHDQDLCLSLCWRAGQPPLPTALKDVYGWIHTVILQALPPLSHARLADCRDCKTLAPFSTRHCFNEPVAFDILSGRRKITGGAICRQKSVFLYQGSLQDFDDAALQSRLEDAFQRALLPS